MASDYGASAGTRSAIGSDVFSFLRQKDFARLDEAGHTYLDYTGAALYPATLVARHCMDLQHSILGNPHSLSPASETSEHLMAAARRRVLDFFTADPNEYTVVFTASATAAIKLVAEGFPFCAGSEFLLSNDNHNSINGVREYARSRGAPVRYLPVDEHLSLTVSERDIGRSKTVPASLFAYPAQSNFSGVQHSLDYIRIARAAGYRVLLDAAAFAPSHRLDLSVHSPDFVCLSFYKMFGYPTGVGALIARRESLALLKRPWFSGGTVDFVSTQHANIHQLGSQEQAFEDGSPNFTSVSGVIEGLNYLDKLGLARIQSHTSKLIERLVRRTGELRHRNGSPLVRWYGGAQQSYGGTRALNFLDRNGSVVPYELVESCAGERGISIRGGCFCNPGCAEAAFGFHADETLRCFNTLDDETFSPAGFAACLGTTEAGAIRVSVGVASNEADIDRFVAFVSDFQNGPCSVAENGASISR